MRITDTRATNRSALGPFCGPTLQRERTLTGCVFVVVVFFNCENASFFFTTALAILDGSGETDRKAADTKTCELNKELKCAQTDRRDEFYSH